MAQRMSDSEIRAFLSSGTKTGKLASVRRDGSPHVVPVWFVLDEDDDEAGWSVVFNTGRDTVKGRAMARDPRLSMCVDDEAPPFSFVRVDGVAELSDDLAEMLPWSTAIAARYMGAAKAAEYGHRNAVDGELLVRLRPATVMGVSGVAAEKSD